MAAETAVSLIFLIILAVALAGFIPVSHPRITREALALLRRTGADSCSVGKVSVVLWKGIRVDGLYLAGPAGGTRRYSLHARSCSVQSNLLGAWMHIGRLREAFRLSAADTAGGLNLPVLRRFLSFCTNVPRDILGGDAEGATVRVFDGKTELLGCEEVSFTIQLTENTSAATRGTFSAGILKAGRAEIVRQLKAGFSGAGTVYTLTHCRGKVLDGRVNLEARIDLGRGALSSLACSVNDFDVGRLTSWISAGSGRLAGRGDCRISLDSSALALDSLRGKGAVSVADFEVAGFPFQQELVGMLQYPGLNCLHFRKLVSDFAIQPGGTIETDAKGDGDSLSIAASGWFRPDGRLNESLDCTLSKEATAALSEFARKTLPDVPGGGKNVRLRVYGNIDRPKVEIETLSILKKAVSNMFDEVRQGIMNLLR